MNMSGIFVLLLICLLLAQITPFKIEQLIKVNKDQQTLRQKAISRTISKGLDTQNTSKKITSTSTTTHFYYLGLEYLEKLDIMNDVLDILSVNTSYQISLTSNNKTYTIHNAQTVYDCTSQHHITQIYYKQFIIYDHQEDGSIVVPFKWTVISGNTSISGSAIAEGLLKYLGYAVQINYTDEGFMVNSLLGVWTPVIYQLSLKSISTDLSDQDKLQILQLINSTEVNSIRSQINQDLQSNFLKQFVKSIPTPGPFSENQRSINYTWQPIGEKLPVDFTFVKQPLNTQVTSTGVTMAYTIGKAKSSATPAFQIYSAVQQFTPFSFYRDFLLESINRGILDDILSYQAWSNADFKYYVYELDAYFTNVYTYFDPYQQITIDCKAVRDSNRVIVSRKTGSQQAFFISADWQCTMKASQKTIVDANVTLQLIVQGLPSQTSLILNLLENTSTAFFNDNYGLKLKSQALGEQLIKKITNSLYEARLIGSNFPLHMPMEQPRITQNDDGVIIYDAAYIKNLQFDGI